MEIMRREAFGRWAKKNGWLRVNDLSTATGRQETYLTPSGGLRAIIYDLEGLFVQVASLGPPEPQGSPLSLGGQVPIIGKG